MAKDTIDVWIEGGGKETLTQQHYKASGGEGTVYQKGSLAYKIMHPGHSIIPQKKMQELHCIKVNNVLIPLNYLLDSKGKPIGFTMRYVHDADSLCKLFNIGFKQKCALSPQDIVDLVREMQQTLQSVHDASILVVDFNQMNFLVDSRKWKIPYFIDTDSYQTPSFLATAIMECIRDRSVPRGQFSIYTDWFSWGVVTFWLYIGTHPYRGKHPSYGNNDWCGKRMDDNISIFDSDVVMPANCCDLSVIPKAHLDWYKKIFTTTDRCIPPPPDGKVIVVAGIQVKDVADFVVSQIFEYDSQIRRIFQENNVRYVITKEKLWADDTPVFNCPVKYDYVGFTKVEDGDVPLFVTSKDGRLCIYDWKNKTIVHESPVENVMVHGGHVYTQSGNKLIKHTCTRIYDRTIYSVKEAANIFGSACSFFDGVVVQDVLGKCRLAIPDKDDDFVNIAVPELDGVRVIDAKYIRGTCVLIAEKSGKITRYVLTFSSSRSNYHVRTAETDIGDSADFIMKSYGLCVSPVEGGDLETWSGDQSKIFKKSPIPMGSLMYTEHGKTMFAVDNKLYSVEKK